MVDLYTGMGAKILTPKENTFQFFFFKKRFSSFLFSVVFQQIRWSSNQLFHNASDYFEMADNTKIQTEEKNNERKVEAKEETVNESVLIYLTTW